MSAIFDDMTWASLVVAVVLLLLAVAAYGAAWLPGDAARRRIATLYLEPLSTWCLIAVFVHLAGLAGSGQAGVLSLGLSVLLAAAAALLRPAGESRPPQAPAVTPAPPPPRAPALTPTPPPAPAPPGPPAPLWGGGEASRQRLWSGPER